MYQDAKGKEKVDEKILRNYIKNIYATLLERGMYGTYIYVCNESLRDYFKRFFTLCSSSHQRLKYSSYLKLYI